MNELYIVHVYVYECYVCAYMRAACMCMFMYSAHIILCIDMHMCVYAWACSCMYTCNVCRYVGLC